MNREKEGWKTDEDEWDGWRRGGRGGGQDGQMIGKMKLEEVKRGDCVLQRGNERRQGKNKRQISFHISLVGCEREMEKNDGMGSQEEEVGMTGYKHVQEEK